MIDAFGVTGTVAAVFATQFCDLVLRAPSAE
jgi:hypothetical protein